MTVFPMADTLFHRNVIITWYVMLYVIANTTDADRWRPCTIRIEWHLFDQLIGNLAVGRLSLRLHLCQDAQRIVPQSTARSSTSGYTFRTDSHSQ